MPNALPHHRIWLGAILAASVAGTVPAYAQNEEPQARTSSDFVSEDWQFQISPWLWGLSISGETTVRGVSTEVDIGFRDILDRLNFGLFLEAEARRNRLGLYANMMFADLGTNAGIGPFDIEVGSTVFMAGAGLGYRLGPLPVGGDGSANHPVLVIDPFVGFRYTNLDVDLDIAGGPDVSAGQDWVDPVFGARTILQIDRNWRVMVLGDVGGFGVGSDFTWQAAGLVGYSFGLFAEDDTTASVGYRALGQDFDTGSGSRRFDWDVVYQGPMASLAIRF